MMSKAFFAVLTTWFALSSAAFANSIADYNTAIQAGDRQTANTVAKALFPTFPKDANGLDIAAFEFALNAYLVDDHDFARSIADDIQSGDIPITERRTVQEAAILDRLSDYTQKPTSDTRAALFEALDALTPERRTTLIPNIAASHIVSVSQEQRRWRDMRRAARLAADFWRQDDRFEASKFDLLAITSEFISSRNRTSYQELAELYATAFEVVSEAVDADDEEARRQHYDEIYTWGLAMMAYLRSDGQRAPDWEKLGSPKCKFDCEPLPEERLKSPFCEHKGLIQRPGLRYPAQPGMRGLVGAVLLEFSLDESGKVIDPKVRAAVPSNQFEDRTLSTVGQWRMDFVEPLTPEGCRKSRTNVVVPVVYSFR